MRKGFLKISLLVIVFVVSTLSINGENFADFIVISGLTKNFQEAEDYCKANKMNLVRGESPKTLEYLLSKNINDFWIDVHLTVSSAYISHGDLSKITLTLWAPGEPQQCVLISNSKSWRFISCETQHSVVCKNDNSVNNIIITGLKKNFREADEYCKTLKMDLVRGEDPKDLLYILSMNLNDFWIDVRPNASSTESKSKYLSYGELQKCVVAKDKLWRSIPCTTLSPVVCTKGYLYIGIFKYEEGYQECKKYGYNLVRADTKESAIDVYDFDLSSKLGYYWIDANDIEKEGTWVHHDGTPAANDLWAPGEPNGAREENCALAHWTNDIKYTWRWVDAPCSTNCATICQI